MTPIPERTRRFRQAYREALPPDYNGWRQQRRITAAMLGVSALLLCGLQELQWTLLVAFAVTWFINTAAEYLAHRFPMHRPLPRLEFMFRQHVRVHHRYFTDQAIAASDPQDVHATVLHPVQLGVLVFGAALPISLGLWATLGGDVARVFGAATLLYLCFFEWVHLACHLPEDHPALRIPGLRWAREHHRLHHKPARMTRTNFQISMPLVDWLTGTGVLEEEEALRPVTAREPTPQDSAPKRGRKAS